MRVMTLNVAHGRRTVPHQLLLRRRTFERNLAEIAAVLRREAPDVVALQEAEGASLWSGRFDHVERLGEMAGYRYRLRGEHVCFWRNRRRICYGCALLSRIPLADGVSRRFGRSLPTPTKGFVAASLRHAGQRAHGVRVASVHLDFSRRRVRARQIEALAAELGAEGGPLIVMGDFNCQWAGREETLRRLCELLGLRPFKPKSSEMMTFPSRRARKRLDWILASPEFEFVECAVLPERLSDHLAVVAEVKRT